MFLLLMQLCVLASTNSVLGDTPANCTYEDVVGNWIFYESERSHSSSLNCDDKDVSTPVQKVRVNLKFPDQVVDQFGNLGTWTMVYNQGFEVTVSGRTYFAFSDFRTSDNDSVISLCNQTQMGWSHDITVRNWACFTGRKAGEVYQPKIHYVQHTKGEKAEETYYHEEVQANLINEAKLSWKASTYPQFQRRSVSDIVKIKGGIRSRLAHKPRSNGNGPLKGINQKMSGFVPDSFDWRNVSGVNYVSQVRDQGACGSCYVFSSMGMLEARVNIATKNTKRFVFSPQDVVSCSNLGQGCEGGFPYLIAGRYGKDFGVVEEKCNPYRGKDEDQCSTKKCLRHYTASYRYVGGYYGGCSEEAMKKALVENGPLSVSFEVYDDFMHYKSGVYHHTNILNHVDNFTPFELTNHAVLLVGYGHEEDLGEDFWTIKNSWGPGWGEGGYFRIRRGVDECAIESLAVEAFVIP